MEWDASAAACVDCRPGTYRDKTSDDLECQACAAALGLLGLLRCCGGAVLCPR